jgi:hypothetical protein
VRASQEALQLTSAQDPPHSFLVYAKQLGDLIKGIYLIHNTDKLPQAVSSGYLADWQTIGAVIHQT